MMLRKIASIALILGATACVETGSDDTDTTADTNTDTDTTATATSGDSGGTKVKLPDVGDAINYRELGTHPGCSTAGLSYKPAEIKGYTCAAKDFTGTEDTNKPIVILVHGNSDTPSSWEAYDSAGACGKAGATEGSDMIAERLSAAGYRTYGLDMRYDLVDDPAGNNDTENLAKNMDHGWGTPLAQHLIESVLDAYPTRQISIVGFSFGTTVARDAVRRLYINEGVDVLPRIDDMVLLAGANHGVSSSALCATNPTMRGKVTCEMGDRAAYTPTAFLTPLNGPKGAYETPCSDGTSAWERLDACDGHSVDYTTIVMEDLPDGTQQDVFVSEASSALAGASNLNVGLTDVDQSNYFFCGFFENHYGAARSAAAMTFIETALAD